jgi:hypothetical protein
MPTTSRDESNPLVRGLNTDETIEIGYEAGIYIMRFMRNGCCPMLLLILGAAALGALAEGSPAGLLLIVVIYNGAALIAFLLLVIYVLFMIVQVKRTKYFITTQRLLEVHGKDIVKQIPKTNLQNLETDQYLKSSWAQKSGTQNYYNTTVTDSISGVVICMTALGEEVSDNIERWVKEGSRKTRKNSSA